MSLMLSTLEQSPQHRIVPLHRGHIVQRVTLPNTAYTAYRRCLE